MARKNYVHFRASADLIERIDALTAESPNGNRSEVIRALLYEALGDDATKAAVLQAVFDFSGVRRIIFAKLADKVNEALPDIVEQALAEGAAE